MSDDADRLMMAPFRELRRPRGLTEQWQYQIVSFRQKAFASVS